MKEIKDYLHLYLGCEIFDDYDSNYKELVSVDLKEWKCRIATRGKVTQHLRNFEEVKPVLRLLNSMTEEESIKADKIHLSAHYSNTPNITIVSEYTRYLLSKHFDLFGLIEAGLAIDKTKN